MPLLALLLPALALLAVGFLHTPPWASSLPLSWRRVNLLSFAATLALGLPTLIASAYPSLTEVLCLSVLSYATAQSLATDCYARQVDRHSLRAALLLPAVVNGTVLWRQGNEILLTYTFVMVVAASTLLLLPRIMGASDARALLLVIVTVVPLLGLPGFIAFMKLALLSLVVGHLLVCAQQARRGELSWRLWTWLKVKVSLPAVPLILLPALSLIAWNLGR